MIPVSDTPRHRNRGGGGSTECRCSRVTRCRVRLAFGRRITRPNSLGGNRASAVSEPHTPYCRRAPHESACWRLMQQECMCEHHKTGSANAGEQRLGTDKLCHDQGNVLGTPVEKSAPRSFLTRAVCSQVHRGGIGMSALSRMSPATTHRAWACRECVANDPRALQTSGADTFLFREHAMISTWFVIAGALPSRMPSSRPRGRGRCRR
jgi:hypothetical protein